MRERMPSGIIAPAATRSTAVEKPDVEKKAGSAA